MKAKTKPISWNPKNLDDKTTDLGVKISAWLYLRGRAYANLESRIGHEDYSG